MFSLLNAYKKATVKTENNVCVDILFDFFLNVLKKENINVYVIPIDLDGELVDYTFPPDLYSLEDNLKKIMNRCDYNMWEEYEDMFGHSIEDEIERIYSYYLKMFDSSANIHFFNEESAVDVIKKSKTYKEWKDKRIKLRSEIESFLKLSICKKVNKEIKR